MRHENVKVGLSRAKAALCATARIGSLLFFSSLFLVLTGCSSTVTRGHEIRPEQFSQIKIGQTTQAEVEALLGQPDDSKSSHGQKVLIYYQMHLESRDFGPAALEGVVPTLAAMALAGKSSMKTDNAEITIGKDGTVADIKRMSMYHHSTGLFVDDDFPKADLTKEGQIRPGITAREQLEPLLGTPPSAALMGFMEGDARQTMFWLYDSDPLFSMLWVYVGEDGLVDEVMKSFKGCDVKNVTVEGTARIKEQQSSRKEAESVLGHPCGMSRNRQGSFSVYYLNMDGTKKMMYVAYSDQDIVTRLILKALPTFRR
jgi:outer membrane protein assembly factor BamE (lipoprotein component of BamABCDE complex)